MSTKLKVAASPSGLPLPPSPTIKLSPGDASAPPTPGRGLPTPPKSPIDNQPSPLRVAKIGPLSAEDYSEFKEQRLHVYKIPDTYIGGDEQVPRNTWLCDFQDSTGPKMTYREISLPEGVERLFLEIISNGGDNADRANRAGLDPGVIEVIMDKTTISIKNGGPPIPVEMHSSGTWVPDMIFGRLLTSSNYDKNVVRLGAGRNGYGAKLANIFSLQFMVIIGDNIRHLKYTQAWNNNMSIRGEPIIEPYHGESFVQVVYTLDFPRFKYTEYPDEAFYLFARHTADVSFTCKVPCTFNGVRLHVQDIKDYAVLFFGEESAKVAIVHREWPPGTETVLKKGIPWPVDEKVAPMVEMCVLDKPDSGINIAFVNGMMTPDGGAHVDACGKALSGPLIEMVNGVSVERTTAKSKGKGKGGGGKGGKTAKDAPKPIKLTLADVKPHISMIIAARLPDPKFKSQTKTMLASPTPKIDIPEKVLQPVMKWQLVERLYAALQAKMYKTLSKTDGKKKRHIFLKKGRDANDAGSSNSMNCTLMIVEGKSASGYAETLISCIPNGKDLYGICPIKGKLLNVRNASFDQVVKNEEITLIKKMMGFQEGLDYREEVNQRTLRYRWILIMTDADNDGNHIKGLILNMLECRFPTFLAGANVLFYNTPYLRIWKGKEMLKFYTTGEFDRWKETHPDWASWKTKYYKGLGTSEDDEVADDMKTQRLVTCVYDDQAPEALSLAFTAKRAEDRRKWLSRWNMVIPGEHIQFQPISHFVNHEFIQFSLVNTQRSIPSLLDGLKESLRKILWAALMYWAAGKDSVSLLKKNPEPMKVAQFGGYVAKETDYHYGEKNLHDTIIRMAQNFVGVNNLPYFKDKGQFGSRETGEPIADARYIFTAPSWWIQYVFKKADIPLLQFREDEGMKIEPYYLLPIVPIVLIDGTLGIGTGHSTYIPSHNPLDIIAWLKAKLKNLLVLPELVPWYRGFQGSIRMKSKLNKLGEASGEEMTEEELRSELKESTQVEPTILVTNDDEKKQTVKTSLITTGVFHVEGNGLVVITELAVGVWTKPFRLFLDELLEEKKISGYRDCGDKNTIRFEITGMSDPSIETLKLQKSYGMSNMVLLNNELRPVKYDTVRDIMEQYYTQRLPFYEARRQHFIKSLEEEMTECDTKALFIQAIVDRTLIVVNRKKSEILAEMKTKNFPPELLTRSSVANLSQDDIAELRQYITELGQKRAAYMNTTPQALWMEDLNEFESAYCEHYKCSPKS